ncbi:MAG: cytochrome C oxidase subunit IV family protein [Polyangiaceae bacterium]|nr:cytochrome C oxidase subunit IV family protein [Polyangiaceae bacterium]
MSEAAADHGHHTPAFYVKIWVILLMLLGVSLAGPEIGIQWVTLLTAFGIAVVKAYLVAKNFMHLNLERRYVVYLLLTAVAFMFLFYAGTSPDIMNHVGRNWTNVAAQAEVERATEALNHEVPHGADHGAEPASAEGAEHH